MFLDRPFHAGGESERRGGAAVAIAEKANFDDVGRNECNKFDIAAVGAEHGPHRGQRPLDPFLLARLDETMVSQHRIDQRIGSRLAQGVEGARRGLHTGNEIAQCRFVQGIDGLAIGKDDAALQFLPAADQSFEAFHIADERIEVGLVVRRWLRMCIHGRLPFVRRPVGPSCGKKRVSGTSDF